MLENRENENRAHCKAIAAELEAYYNGDLKRCPRCGEIHRRNWDEINDVFRCPACGDVGSVDDWETISIWEYFDDVFDIEYRIGSDREYRSVCVMVACGGPNVYIDTATKNVELYWWGDRASYPIGYDVCNEIDYIFEEYFNC